MTTMRALLSRRLRCLRRTAGFTLPPLMVMGLVLSLNDVASVSSTNRPTTVVQAAFLSPPAVRLAMPTGSRRWQGQLNTQPAAGGRRKCPGPGFRIVSPLRSARALAGDDLLVSASPPPPPTSSQPPLPPPPGIPVGANMVRLESPQQETRPQPRTQPTQPQQQQQQQRQQRLQQQQKATRAIVDCAEEVPGLESGHVKGGSFRSVTDGDGGGGRWLLRPVAVLAAVMLLTALFIGYEHRGTPGLDWVGTWPWRSSTFPTAIDGPSDALGEISHVHFTPFRSLATGAGAGLTRAVSRTFTFPLDTLKTRGQVSRMREEDRAAMPEEMCRVIDRPASFRGVFSGFSAFLVQAAPSNAVFFLFYDALNAIGAATLLAEGSGIDGLISAGSLSTAVHLGASSLATVPCTLVRTPAEVVKQRLQVGQESGSALKVVKSIVKSDGIGGLFVGGKEQLLREIPFNAIQFTAYECLKTYIALPEFWTDAALGAAAASAAALATQPIDTVKTRVMTKSVPGFAGKKPPGFLASAAYIANAERSSALFLGLLPRMVLVSTGGAFYFWGEDLVSQVLSWLGA